MKHDVILLLKTNGDPMIKSKLHILMGERKIKSILQLHQETKITRKSLTNLYNDNFKAIDVDTINRLCVHFNCGLCDLLEFVEDQEGR